MVEYGPPIKSMQYGTPANTASRHSVIAFGWPGRLITSAPSQMPAVWTRQDRRRHHLQRGSPHRLSEARQQFRAHHLSCLGRDVSTCRTRTARGQDETATHCGKPPDRLFHLVLFVGNEDFLGRPVRGHDPIEVVVDSGPAAVFVLATARSVGHRDDAEQSGCRPVR